MGGLERLHVFALGALGGCLVELLRWWKLREAAEYPVYAKKFGYWAITVLMIVAGGVTASLYGLGPTNAAALVNIGAATPAILGALASKAEGAAPPRADAPALDQKSFKGSGIRGLAQSELVRKFVAFGR
jgi:hypothetical protein